MMPFVGIAQEDLNKMVQVTGAYDPIISDAEKIEMPVTVSDTLLDIKGGFQYSIKPQGAMSNFALRPMPAAKLNEKAYKDPRWLYARIGAGYPLQFLGDIYMQNLKPEDVSYGLFYNHRSIWAKIDNPDGENIPIDELNHEGGIYFRKNWEKMIFNTTVGFNHHNVLFYGYNTAVANRANHVVNKDSISQSYTSFYVNAGISSLPSESKFIYAANLMFDVFGDNGKNKFNKGRVFSMNENKVGANFMIGTSLNEGKHILSLKADGNVYLRNLSFNNAFSSHFNNSAIVYSYLFDELYGIYGSGKDTSDTKYIFNLNPSYSVALSKFHLELGVKYTGYQKAYSMKHKFYPMVNAELKLVNEFVPYAGISGGVNMNDYKSVVAQNPFITPGLNMSMKATDCAYSINGGFKGNIQSVFSYNVYGNYSILNDSYFFVNSYQTLPNNNPAEQISLRNNFDVLFDDMQLLKVGADFKVIAGPIDVSLSAAYYHCTLDKVVSPFHLPQYEANANIDISAGKYLTFNVNAYGQTKSSYAYTQALDEVGFNDGFINLGLGAEYIFTKNFSVFLNVNNVLNSKYEIWHGYRVPGIGALGGITFKL